MLRLNALIVLVLSVATVAAAEPDRLLVEAESFTNHGGWKLDTQFIEIMGSPYMLAHGLGDPVEDATTAVEFPSIGTYRVFVRTKDWVARWDAAGAPGKFQVLVDGKPLAETFGTKGAEWHWHDGGTVEITDKNTALALRDLTGFDGRADAIYFTKDLDLKTPPNGKILPQWRRELLGLKEAPTEMGPYDLVVVGGGYSGMGAAISAARQGIKVALIQNRPVLGGNGSSEVRVWAMGLIRRGNYPHVGDIIAEIEDNASKSPGTYEEFEDKKKERIVRAEPNIDLFLNHHAYDVNTEGDHIKSVIAFNTRTSEWKKFNGKLFVDCTGHGTIGALAGADYDVHDGIKMGMSNMWRWDEKDQPVDFPKTPWALDLNMDDFPYPRDHHGQWFWESGFEKDSIKDLEYIRDWNLRAVYGAFNAMKNRDGAAKHKNADLTWVAYIGGTRESRRLMGDVVLTQEDIVSKRQFKDGCVPSTWSIDLHYPKKQFMKKYPDNPFISVAVHDRRVDRNYGYPVPYRCFYSRNINNLFMAGRCISVTHQALGTVRVMKTCGMMGEVVGKAASVCVQRDCTPREVYQQYWDEMDRLLKTPGVQRRDTLDGDYYVREDAVELPEPVMVAYRSTDLPGIVVDDAQAKLTGNWSGGGGGLHGYIDQQYRYTGDKNATMTFTAAVPKSGKYEVRYATLPHENRSPNTPITIRFAGGEKTIVINQKQKPDKKHNFVSLGVFEFDKARPAVVIVNTKDTDGTVHADAVQLLPIE